MTFRATLIKETNNAKLIEHGGREIWLPRSQISCFTRIEVGKKEGEPQVVELTIPGWLASVKGIES